MRKALYILIFSFFLLPAWEPVHAQKPPRFRTVTFPSGEKIEAEVADTPEARQMGLMFRETLPGGGMLFIFQQAAPHRFWMKNCKFPIDIIWLNDQKEIIYLSEKTPPCESDPCPNYGPSRERALYVLEVASGFAEKERLKPGMKVRF